MRKILRRRCRESSAPTAAAAAASIFPDPARRGLFQAFAPGHHTPLAAALPFDFLLVVDVYFFFFLLLLLLVIVLVLIIVLVVVVVFYALRGQTEALEEILAEHACQGQEVFRSHRIHRSG